ncbi:MAG: gliding motility-associated C-terminal domain-containing protein [Chitinophagaceae bacterium]
MNQFYLRYLLVIFYTCLLAPLSAQQLIDVAGTGIPTYSGDNGPALSASLNSPSAFVVTKNNELWITDIDNHRIRAINIATGIIRTVAGTGVPSFSGDGGAATRAGLNQPKDLVQDNNGNVYFTDIGNARVRKIDINGTITTVAGNGSQNYSEGANALLTGLPEGGSVAVDPQGNVYITDNVLRKVLRVDQATKTIRTFAGNGSGVYSGDGGNAVDAGIPHPHVVRYYPDNSIIVSDIDAHVIRKISISTGIIQTIIGIGTPGYSGDGGPAKSAQLNLPLDHNIDSAGNIYIADGDNHVIRRFNAATGEITTIAGTGEPGYDGANIFYKCSRINVPVAVVWSPDGIVYIGEWIGLRVRKIDPTPVIPTPPVVRLAPLPSPICPGTPLLLRVDRMGGFAGDPHLEWFRNGQSTGLFGPSASIPTVNNGDIISVRAIGNNNTCGVDSAITSTIPLTIADIIAATAEIRGDSILCPEETTNFTAKSNYRLKDINWTVNNINSAQGASFQPSGLRDGSVIQFRAVVDTSGCLAGTQVFSRTLTIDVLPAPALTLSPADTSIEPGNSVTLRSETEPGITQFLWSGTGVLPNGAVTQTVQPERTGTYTVRVTNALGCTQTAEAKIRVIRPVFIPNSFTPNADGKNDLFRIPPDTDLELVVLRVFNRFGEMVWETTDQTQGWDGTIKGLPAPVGTYIYQLRYRQDKIVERKGAVTLIR